MLSSMRAVSDDAPLLQDLMPWSVRPLRLGRSWPMAPEPACLKARWSRLTATDDDSARAALLHPTRARGPYTAVAQLPGHRTPTTALAREQGPCPEPVRVRHGAYDQQWLIPDHRLIDAARPELWRVADDAQVFAVERAPQAEPDEPALSFSSLLPDGHSPAGRPSLIRPLFRQPGGREPNLAPGLTDWLAARLGLPVTAYDVLAWIAAAARPGPSGAAVPLPEGVDIWRAGVDLGARAVWLHTRGARFADAASGRDSARLRPPGGSRPYVRSPLPAVPPPDGPEFDPDEQVLRIGTGQVSPVSAAAWDVTAGGVRVLEHWYGQRVPPPGNGSLEALCPPAWTRAVTSELLELISLLTLLAALRPDLDAFGERLSAAAASGATPGAADLRTAGVLPVPAARRRPASVLEHHEEGPDGQFALL